MLCCVFCPGLAWIVIPREYLSFESGDFTFHSWRVFVALCTVPSITSAAMFVLMPESPKYLLQVRWLCVGVWWVIMYVDTYVTISHLEMLGCGGLIGSPWESCQWLSISHTFRLFCQWLSVSCFKFRPSDCSVSDLSLSCLKSRPPDCPLSET